MPTVNNPEADSPDRTASRSSATFWLPLCVGLVTVAATLGAWRSIESARHAHGEAVFAEHDTADALYVIIRGRVKIHRGDEQLASLGPGEPFGEMAALDGSPRSASATATEDSELLRIDSDEFYEVLHEQVELAEGIIRTLIARLRLADSAATSARAPHVV